MKHTTNYGRFVLVFSVLLLLTLVSGIAVAQIQVVGDFNGTLGGYGDEANEDLRPNEIVVDGEFTVQGEPAQNVEVIIQSAKWTVLNTNSVSVFVEGSESVAFDKRYSAGEVRLVTDRIPAGTTVQIAFSTYFTGGTKADEVEAGSVRVNYETLGGTADGRSFTADVTAADSADNEISELRDKIASGESAGLAIKVLAAIGGLAIVVLVIYLIINYRDSGPEWQD